MTRKRALPTKRVDFSPRLAHLEDLAQEEGTTIAPESRADLDLLTSQFPPQASAQLVLTDDGHLRVVWQDQEGNHAAFRLLGHGKVRYVLFRSAPHGGPTTRTSGDAPMEEAVRMARSMGIPAFPEQHELEDLPPEIVDTLTGIAALPRDWNSYGASPISPQAIEQARELVRKALTQGLTRPGISPATGGAVSIEWKTPDFHLVIDADPRYYTTYLLTNLRTGEEEEGQLDGDNTFRILAKTAGN